jgi:hypothetical protein
MDIRKRLDKDTVVSAHHFEEKTTGITLAVKKTDDKHYNSVALIEIQNGKPCLVLIEDAIKHAGLEIKKENTNPKEW